MPSPVDDIPVAGRPKKPDELSKLVLLGENHLRAAVHEYLAHGQLISPPAKLNREGRCDLSSWFQGMHSTASQGLAWPSATWAWARAPTARGCIPASMRDR